MSNTLLYRAARPALAGLILAGSLGMGFAGVAAAAPGPRERPATTSTTNTTRPEKAEKAERPERPEVTTSTTRPERPRENEFSCGRAVAVLREMKEHNDELAQRFARLDKLREAAVTAGNTEAVARIDKAIAGAKARQAKMVDKAKALAAKVADKCSPADKAVADDADVDG